MKKLFITLLVLVLVMAGLWYWSTHRTVPVVQNDISSTPVMFACANNKSINATFIDGDVIPSNDPTMPPTPTGKVDLVLSDGRAMTLKQTLSADGGRYSNGDPNVEGSESFVFWNKGNDALVLENNQQKSYIGCILVSDANKDTLPLVYSAPDGSFSIRTPQGYTADESYKYEQLGPGKEIYGVKFTVPTSLTTGTNLSSDSYISVEHLANTTSCSADKFVQVNPENKSAATPQMITDHDTTYSYLTSMDAAAGNRYEETVYALDGSNPCMAIRYYVHYGAIENYPDGTVQQFDAASLKKTFDMVRESVILGS